MNRITAYLSAEADVLQRMPEEPLASVSVLLRAARNDGRTIFIFGNGGSAANASHFMVDMVKGTLEPGRPRVRLICLNDNIPTLTALANDLGYDSVFAEPLASLGRSGDIVIAISGSGNSANVLKAMQTARAGGMTTIGLSGADGGSLRQLCDLMITVPSDSMQLVEDAHRVILHALFVEMCQP